MCENLITGLAGTEARAISALLRWTIKIKEYLSNYLTKSHKNLIKPEFLILHISYFNSHPKLGN